MKKSNYYISRSIVAIVLGLLLVMWPDVAVNYLVITIGVLFLVAGLISLIGYFMHKDAAGSERMFPVGGLGSILLGVVLMAAPVFFVNIIMYLLGGLLAVGGGMQIVFLMRMRRYTPVPVGFYAVPVLLVIAGAVVIANPFSVASAAFLLLGICCLVYAVSEFVNGYKFRKYGE